MTPSIFIFTFSPIQSFISEARRAADLYTGSQVLVKLAKAAALAIGKERLIYPALDENGELPQDIPNKLVAKVSWEDCETIAADARAALQERWRLLAEEARQEFLIKTGLPFDMDIWNRQTGEAYLWETYWCAAQIENDDYKAAYQQAEQGMAALKFTRPFRQFPEPGFKDTLSGRREALHPAGQDGREYWLAVGKIDPITPIKIRPSTKDRQPERERPRERLDAIGVIKRFHPELSERKVLPFRGFPSTSSMAAWTFLECAREFAGDALKAHRAQVKALLPDKKYEVRLTDPDWPFDGDLLYPETLRPRRMESDYGQSFNDEQLKPARKSLQDVYDALKTRRKALEKTGDERAYSIHIRPSTYYAVLALDGDSMGEHLRLLDEEGHRRFSASLRRFAESVPRIAKKHRARVIYNGGDDVLAFAPLDTAIPFAQALADSFQENTARTASAGIAIAHHLAPLSAALEAAGQAEHWAKQMPCKNALAVFALRRSGEDLRARSGWDEIAPFKELVEAFERDTLSARLPYDVARSAYALPKADDMLEAELRRLLKRHWQGKKEERDPQAQRMSLALRGWAASFPADQAMQLSAWLALARFVAKGGRE